MTDPARSGITIGRAPARVNLIGDHTDYTGGLVLPMAIDRWTEVRVRSTGDNSIRLVSSEEADAAVIPLDVSNPAALTPQWARYVGAVVAEVRPSSGFEGTVTSTVPSGSGLSSSAALEVACALAFGASGSDVLALAQLCQRAEHRAVGVPSGIMDQLASAAGVQGHALLIDCTTMVVTPIALPPANEVEVVVIHSGQPRALADSAYAERVAQCQAAEAIIGPLHLASATDVGTIDDPLVRARARHVVSENQRVRDFVGAIGTGDLTGAGHLMYASHESLRADYGVSTAVLDDMCQRLAATPGVLGARLTGAGFGGCVVVLCRPGAVNEGWNVRAVDGAHVIHEP